MNLAKLLDSISGIKLENRFQRITSILLSLIILILVFGLINRKPVVTLVPPNLSEKAEVSSSSASSSYKKALGMYVATLAGNVTPENVDFIQRELGKIMTPQLYQAFQTSLEEQAQTIKDQSLSVWFRPDSVRHQNSTDVIFVTGKSTTEGPYGEPMREQRTYEFEFIITNYWPMISFFDSYAGGPNLNAASMRKQKEREQRRSEKQDGDAAEQEGITSVQK